MLTALTCALCLSSPTGELRLHLDAPPTAAAASVDLRLVAPAGPPPYAAFGSGDGEPHHHDDGDHMTTMWVVMGVMMAAMMAGAGVYAMRHSSNVPATNR